MCAGKPEPQEYKRKEAELDDLKQKDDENIIELYFMDESGFCLIPYVPYGWQPLGQYLGILSRMSDRLNVLGFLRRNGELESYVSKQ
ncbi:MAG: IS630 family transposase, partial [Cyanobacteria bacterium P01_F01_bin.150]